ncbi:MAG: hypothetical protein HS108_06905 [Planctomycetes bacterium]|nr:hypothetical protein [Planctomycetota bacterium]
MDAFHKALRRFHFRLMLRLSGYAALWGLLLALLAVIAAPWLRQVLGAPDYYVTLALPVVLPGLYVAWVWLRRPDTRTIVQAADAWSGNTGAVVAAHELAQDHPDSPFVGPTLERATALMIQARLPEPAPLRWAMTALLVMLGLVPLSRWAHAQMQQTVEQEKAREAAKKVDVPPAEAEKLAKEAGTAAETAKQLGATQQEKLADDLEQAARDAQAGGQDKERALRDAHALVDRARTQRQQQDARQDARDALRKNDDLRELVAASERADARAVAEQARQLVEQLQAPDGTLDPEKARQMREAIEEARRMAPNDAGLRRAAEALKASLDERARKNTRAAREQLARSLAEEGRTDEEVRQALARLDELDRQALARQLEELARQISPLRDLDPSGKRMEELLRQIKDRKLSPEQARELAEQARELSKRLELDAETLRRMLQEGRSFEGLEELAREMVRQAREQGTPIQPGEAPDWVQKELPKEWQEAGRAGRDGTGQGGRQGDDSGGAQAEGRDGGPDTRGGGHSPNTREPTRGVDGHGTREGVDTRDTGQGDKDPGGKPERLDPDKAKDERARREATGAEGTGTGVNTKEEEERLPRRYRETARKYFER